MLGTVARIRSDLSGIQSGLTLLNGLETDA